MQFEEPILKAVIDALPFHVFWLDNNVKVLGCNLLHQINFGIDSEASVGKSIEDFGQVLGWENEMIHTVSNALATPIYTKETFCYFPELGLPNKEKRIFSSWTIPIIENNRVSSMLGFGFDLTNFKQNQVALEKSFASKKTPAEIIEVLSKLMSKQRLDLRTIKESQTNQHALLMLTHKVNSLTKREKDCIKLLMQGFNSTEIGFLLHLSKRTIEHYISNAKDKLNCKNTAELVFKCTKAGLLK